VIFKFVERGRRGQFQWKNDNNVDKMEIQLLDQVYFMKNGTFLSTLIMRNADCAAGLLI
jgi:hypothetical protein